jgi:DNA-directed RNA polymerase subunit F
MIVQRDKKLNSSENKELKLAADYVQQTGNHIFLTGKAGTGKTTFLHNLKNITTKRLIVTAPTGVAAINAGGVTLHSFFQLPFGPFIPGGNQFERNGKHQLKYSKEKKEIIKNLDLLIIDEISMVRADLLDSVDAILRRFRQNDLPFGGVQLLMIGDLHQLSPVAKQDEWEILKQYYTSVYFFDSHALNPTEMVTIELNHIYRQSDAKFIGLLNKVRNNQLDTDSIRVLNQRYIKNFTPNDELGYITLTTHNNSAERINEHKLTTLTAKKYCFNASVSGDFPEHSYPSPSTLVLKVDAQVMFLRNDPSPEKQFFNGKIGKIKSINRKHICVQCPQDTENIVVEPVEWENIKYTVNKESNEINEEIIGTFTQFPLKLAWAITIHKSQGLTFNRAIIDAAAAFTHGQVYVALSRCRSYEGMVLSSPLPQQGITISPIVIDFMAQTRRNPPSKEKFQDAKRKYLHYMVTQCFDFTVLYNHLNRLVSLIMEKSNLLQVSGIPHIREVQTMFGEQIFTVSEKFKQQINTIFVSQSFQNQDTYLMERIGKASVWFKEKIALFHNHMAKLEIETDNKDLGKSVNSILQTLIQEAAVKKAGIQSCTQGFSPSHYLRAISNVRMNNKPGKKRKPKLPDYGKSGIEHVTLFNQLKEWRLIKAKKQGIANFQILHQRVLIQIVNRLPKSPKELKMIKGFGKKTLQKYGEDIVSIVRGYCVKKGINKADQPEYKEKPVNVSHQKKEGGLVSHTKQLTFTMFNKGLSILDIAQKRSLAKSTIEGHLCFFIETGILDINKVVPPQKQEVIKNALSKASDNSLKKIKETLADDFSYGDIKLVIAHQNYQAFSTRKEGI